MRKLLLATTALLALTSAGNSAVIGDLGVDPTSSQGAFNNGNLPTGLFNDQWTFQLTTDATIVIGSATNVFPRTTDFITNFTGRVFEIVGTIGGGDDILVLGPATAVANNCGLNCQVFGGSAVLDAGDYYLNISGNAGLTAGYGGDLAVVAPSVPEPSTWAMMILGFAGIGFMAYRRKQSFRLV